MTVRAGVLALVLLPLAGSLRAQAVARRDTLRLAELQDAAKRLDPRERQLALQRQATALRLRRIAADRLPALSGEGMAQYQSVVTTLPIRLPNVTVPGPPHDTYDAHLLAQERLYDPTLGPRRDVERASLATAEARVRTTVYALRNDVNDAFFSAALAEARAGELTAAISDLETQLRVAQARVREGTAARVRVRPRWLRQTRPRLSGQQLQQLLARGRADTVGALDLGLRRSRPRGACRTARDHLDGRGGVYRRHPAQHRATARRYRSPNGAAPHRRCDHRAPRAHRAGAA